MLEGYRKANHIELIDMRLTLHPRDWSDGLPLYDFYAYSGYKSYSIHGNDLVKLLEVLGIEAAPYRDTAYSKKEGRSITKWYNPTNLDFMIHENLPEVLAGDIKEVWAKIVTDKLLEILIVYRSNENEAYAITYSGSFAVHWLEQVNKDDDG